MVIVKVIQQKVQERKKKKSKQSKKRKSEEVGKERRRKQYKEKVKKQYREKVEKQYREKIEDNEVRMVKQCCDNPLCTGSGKKVRSYSDISIASKLVALYNGECVSNYELGQFEKYLPFLVRKLLEDNPGMEMTQEDVDDLFIQYIDGDNRTLFDTADS